MSHGPLAISGFFFLNFWLIGSLARLTNCFLTCLGSLILHPGDFGDQVKLRVAQNLGAFSLLIRKSPEDRLPTTTSWDQEPKHKTYSERLGTLGSTQIVMVIL